MIIKAYRILAPVIVNILHRMKPEDYKLNFCLLDKNNIVVFESELLLEDYSASDVDWVINKLATFLDETNKR